MLTNCQPLVTFLRDCAKWAPSLLLCLKKQGPAQREGGGGTQTCCSDLVHGVCVCVIRQAGAPEQWVLRTAHVPHQHLTTVEPPCGTKRARAGADPCPAAQLPGQAPALPPPEPGCRATSLKTIPSGGGKVRSPSRPHCPAGLHPGSSSPDRLRSPAPQRVPLPVTIGSHHQWQPPRCLLLS